MFYIVFVTEAKIPVNLSIGDYSKQIIGIQTSGEKYKSSELAKQIINTINILGYEVFKNHKIKLDFEHMEFRIE